MKIAVTPADQEVARLDVALAERLGEDVDPRVKIIAEMDLAALRRPQDSLPDAPGPQAVWLDDQTGEVIAVSEAAVPKEAGPPAARSPTEEASSRRRRWRGRHHPTSA